MQGYTIIYVSKVSDRFDLSELERICATANERNTRNGISGLLLYSGDHFLQVLEGRPRVLEMLYERIQTDDRHTDIERLLWAPIRKRNFPRWAMGVLDISRSLHLDRDKFRFICDQAACDPAAASRAALSVLKMFRRELGDDSFGRAA